GNKQFILNAVNYLCDDSGLMEIRSRELKLRLLDKVRIKDERLKWQLINIIAPLVFIVLFGLLVSYWRKRRYAK
ncbi:MAG: gliding motility-associated ABC transporter substrate-binding protein GldG, partial [Bacteroidetes bacterium]|nr:gliding motility-associated ABC transporter substrate-binding protein GldG [Bacteroidota bacterium]